MKDSQIGTYGTLALIIATGLRWICYATLLPVSLVPLFVAAVLSRAMMPLAMAVLPHARDNGLSHSVGRPGSLTVVAGLLIALMTTLFLVGPLALLGGLSALISAAGVIWLAHRKIAGQTGDVLGAIQQISEITILITYTVLAL